MPIIFASLLVYFSLIFFSYAETDYESCINPSRDHGQCIPLKLCPDLLEILREDPIRPHRIKFLQASTCSFVGEDPWVCCTSPETPIPVENPPAPSKVDESLAIKNHSNWKLLPKKSCGTAPSQVIDRIIGGEAAELGAHPWLVLIAYEGPTGDIKRACGGTLINRLYVLTAAHCVHGLPAGYTVESVRIGEYDQDQDPDCQDGICAPEHQDYEVEEIIIPERYGKPARFDHDIALMRLKRRVTMGPFVQPICLPQGGVLENNIDEEGYAVVAGWGRTLSHDSELSPLLLQASIPIVPMKRCREVHGLTVSEGGRQLCAGGQKGTDSCKGDSGGPIMKTVFEHGSETERTYQIGIVSFGYMICGDGKPAIYTKVLDYVPWILDNIRP